MKAIVGCLDSWGITVFRLLLCFLSLILMPAMAIAETVKVEMVAAIVDPTLLDHESATLMCEENPDMVKCEVVKEKIRVERAQDAIGPFPDYYDVLVASFE